MKGFRDFGSRASGFEALRALGIYGFRVLTVLGF